jgi:flagellar biosynthesis/type III secretory pathway protein FliH
VIEPTDYDGAWKEVHRCAQATAKDPVGRRRGKLEVVRQLATSGRSPEEVREVFRLINWLLALPAPEELKFRQELLEERKETSMPHLSTYDQLVREEGWQEGRQEGRQEGLTEGQQVGRKQACRELILEQLAERFGPLPAGWVEALEQVHEETRLRALVRRAATVESLEQFALWPPA